MNFLPRAVHWRVRQEFVHVLHCRRCESESLLELVRLAGGDHTVYRCRDCGFLFSPPDGSAGAAEIEASPLGADGPDVLRRRAQAAASRRQAQVAAVQPRQGWR